MELMMEHVGKGLLLTLILSMPCVLTAAGIGLVMGILQAVTQVQEQTIAAAPKIVAVFLVLLLGGSIMVNVIGDYVRDSFRLAFEEIPHNDGPFLLPPLTSDAGTMRARSFFHDQTSASPGKLSGLQQSKPGINSDDKPDNGTAVFKSGGNRGSANSLPERMTLKRK